MGGPLSGSGPRLSRLPCPSFRRSSFFSTDAAGTSASAHGHPTAAPQPLRSSVQATARDPPASASTPYLPSCPPPAGPPGPATPSPAENQNWPGAPWSPPLGRQCSLKFGNRVNATASFSHLDRTHLQLRLIPTAKGLTELRNANSLLIYRFSFPPRWNHL